jgi:zinc transport system substrate-binding protein
MIKYIPLILFVTVLSGCLSKPDGSAKKVITVSILPQKYFVQAIAGDKYEVSVMIPPGGAPETYEPTARQMQILSESPIYLKIGHIPFEEIWLKNIGEFNPLIKVYNLSQGIDLIRGGHSHEGEDEISGIDPHIWSSPRNASIIAVNIYNALCEEDPDNKTYYNERLDNFLLLADSLDKKFQSEFARSREKTFIIFHPALAYLARDYGLLQISLEFEGKSPPPGHMKDIINIAHEKNIRKILIQKQFNVESAITIANEIGGDVVIIDPLDENWKDQIEYIVTQIAGK